MSPGWKYKITVETPNWVSAQEWCEVHIGKFDQDWYKLGIDPLQYILEGKTQTVWLFKKLEHANLFALRWS